MLFLLFLPVLAGIMLLMFFFFAVFFFFNLGSAA